MSDHTIIDDIIRREGSTFTNDPLDRGGETKYGVTQRAWREYRDRHPAAGHSLPIHVRDLERHHAEAFYLYTYVHPRRWIRGERLRHLVVDCSVLHGASRATRWLQEAAGVTVDGLVGPVTRAAVNDELTETYRKLLVKRFNFIATLVVLSPSQLRFLRGWIARCAEFVR